MEAANALHKIVPGVPSYENGFVAEFLCEHPLKDCWFGRCNKCSGVTVDRLKVAIGDTPHDTSVSWFEWKKNLTANRIEKQKVDGSLSDLIAHVVALSPQFLKHSYVKREQAEMFNSHDRPRASNEEFSLEALLQVDFAENFVCESQDEVQSAHWNQRQLSCFTSALYYNESFQSKVYVSNNLAHKKETIVPYMYKLLIDLPSSVKILKVWSDGPSSQFKNKYIAAIIHELETIFDLKIIWNYFATSHGKGCVDGLGATVKKIVRNHIKARDCIVNDAADFVHAFKRTQSKILVEEVTEAEFTEINDKLGSAEIFSKAKNVQGIQSAHQIQFTNGKLATFETSKEGYN